MALGGALEVKLISDGAQIDGETLVFYFLKSLLVLSQTCVLIS